MKAALIMLALLCAGCAGKDAYREMVLVDEQSGCEYIGYVEDGGISTAQLKRRMGADGEQICREVAK